MVAESYLDSIFRIIQDRTAGMQVLLPGHVSAYITKL